MCAGRWSPFRGILLLTGVLIANLYNLQIVRFTDYQTRSNETAFKLAPIAPSRGIYLRP
ncbi:hypothetical protein ACVXHA_00975 [Escherichia coli]